MGQSDKGIGLFTSEPQSARRTALLFFIENMSMHTPKWPSEEDLCYILKMLESRLIDYRFTEPWADALIATVEVPPPWLCDLASRTHLDDLVNAVQYHLTYWTNVNGGSRKLGDFYIGCLFQRHKRGDFDWKFFIREAAQYAEGNWVTWHFEWYYQILQRLEKSNREKALEESQRLKFEADGVMGPAIALAEEQYRPFRIARYGA
ncbi:MAG: hypothetical protein HS116_08255 [Planctomycetes bacterium]|nr:hypothetical protein [Planctomycetota bacterium]